MNAKIEKIRTIVSGILLILVGFLALVLIALVHKQQKTIKNLKNRVAAYQKICKESQFAKK